MKRALAVLTATAGLIAAGALEITDLARGAQASTKAVKFSFTQSAMPKGFHFPVPNDGHAPLVYCQWPNGKTSITAVAARRVTCFPRGSHFPDLSGRGWALLDSPIGGKKYPTLNGKLSNDLRLIHASNMPGVMDVSPVLMQFGDYSGGARPSIIARGDSLWLYDYVTEHGAELLRVSTSRGRIVQRTAMPAISRPACTVNQYGFWMAQAPNSFFSKKTQLGVWDAPFGAKRGVRVRATDEYIVAIGTRGSTVYVDAEMPPHGTSAPAQYLWRFAPKAS